MIAEPPIKFSKWCPWDEALRHEVKKRCTPFSSDLEWPGIYVWAFFEIPPNAALELESPPQEVRYIGEAKITLRSRINQFGRCYALGGASHAGGGRLAKIVAGLPGGLYLSYFSLATPNEPDGFRYDRQHWYRPFLHYVERRLLWNYVRQWDTRPCCNFT